MKMRFLKIGILTAFALVAGYNVCRIQKPTRMLDVELSDVEALAGCEVSSNSSSNTGICCKDVNTSREYCVTSSSQWGGGPKCSGTI